MLSRDDEDDFISSSDQEAFTRSDPRTAKLEKKAAAKGRLQEFQRLVVAGHGKNAKDALKQLKQKAVGDKDAAQKIEEDAKEADLLSRQPQDQVQTAQQQHHVQDVIAHEERARQVQTQAPQEFHKEDS